MQKKTVEKKLRSKMEKWINSIEDLSLREKVKNDLLASGGSIASMFLGEKVNDYDIYLTNINTANLLAIYYTKSTNGSVIVLDGRRKNELIEKAQESNYEDFYKRNDSYSSSLRNLKEDQIKLFIGSGNGGYKVELPSDFKEDSFLPVFYSPNAISLSDEIQVVLRFNGTAEQIHKTFDFIHATNYFTMKEGLVTNLEAQESILTRQLKYQGSLYPITSVIRMKKFLPRGFRISAGDILKMAYQISLLDLSDMDILEEQLIGVDVAYFEALISALREKQTKDESFEITSDYISRIIDKIFSDPKLEDNED